MAQPINYNDPCALYAALQAAYFQIISGGKASKISYVANGVSREVNYAFANLNLLKMELLKAEDLCLIAGGHCPVNTRHAISAGSRRHDHWGDPFVPDGWGGP